MLKKLRKNRVALFFFDGDPFDPGGRADQSKAILKKRGLDHLVVDRPATLHGHGSANTPEFSKQYAGQITRFITP